LPRWSTAFERSPKPRKRSSGRAPKPTPIASAPSAVVLASTATTPSSSRRMRRAIARPPAVRSVATTSAPSARTPVAATARSQPRGVLMPSRAAPASASTSAPDGAVKRSAPVAPSTSPRSAPASTTAARAVVGSARTSTMRRVGRTPRIGWRAVSIAAKLQGKRIIICAGSGGVGKTTTSAALAMGLAAGGLKVAVVTIDPAKRLADSLGLEDLDNEPRRSTRAGSPGTASRCRASCGR
jgi:Mrp family chromosome partitioning ATPase